MADPTNPGDFEFSLNTAIWGALDPDPAEGSSVQVSTGPFAGYQYVLPPPPPNT